MLIPPPPSDKEQDSTNIFYLSKCAYTSAEWMHEPHTVKMITESAQMLSAAVQMMACDRISELYKPAYIFHPCTQWVMESVWHYEWLMRHYEALSAKYARLFNRQHMSYWKLVAELRKYYYLFPRNQWRDPPLCMPDKYKIHSTTEECYRAYYLGEKVKGRCYYKINPPFWINNVAILLGKPMELDDTNSDGAPISDQTASEFST